jgi:hypothetical protein
MESNRASYLAAKSELQETTLGIGAYDALHAMDYMVFAHLQQAQDRAAKQSLDEVAAIRKVNVENSIAAYAFASIPARFALERGDWKQAAALSYRPPIWIGASSPKRKRSSSSPAAWAPRAPAMSRLRVETLSVCRR